LLTNLIQWHGNARRQWDEQHLVTGDLPLTFKERVFIFPTLHYYLPSKHILLPVLTRFRANPLFLLTYYGVCTLILSLGIALFLATGLCSWPVSPWDWLWVLLLVPLTFGGLRTIMATAVGYALLAYLRIDVSGWQISVLPPVGVMTGLYSAATMHMCVHRVLFPRWINTVMGELCALQQILGYPGWGISHLLHHKHPDDPQLDPHPPANSSFWSYADRMKYSIVACLDRAYYSQFGNSTRTILIWRITKLLLVLNRALRALFWLVLLGPAAFVLFFLPSFVVQIAFYSHFNWATHRPLGEGRYGIFNRNDGLYYHLMNKLLWGIYYHANHHRSPARIDPRRGADKSTSPYVSYVRAAEP
jgi:Fatty acid desaturase